MVSIFCARKDMFDEPHLISPARPAGEEERWSATGLIDGIFVTVIYTERGKKFRIISMRRARQHERRGHQELFGH
jgi:uncharacterized DUF497 family protein